KAQTADIAMRAFAFHTKMGFFNPKQLFLQSTAAVNVMAIAGVTHGTRGARIFAPLMLASRTKAEFIKPIGKKTAAITGWNPDEYMEMAMMYRRSGFQHVGGDVAYLDDYRPPGIRRGAIKSATHTVLDWGGSFFRTGERVARTMAFAAAYSERKAF